MTIGILLPQRARLAADVTALTANLSGLTTRVATVEGGQAATPAGNGDTLTAGRTYLVDTASNASIYSAGDESCLAVTLALPTPAADGERIVLEIPGPNCAVLLGTEETLIDPTPAQVRLTAIAGDWHIASSVGAERVRAVAGEALENERVPWVEGNRHRLVTAEINGHVFDFDWIGLDRDDHPLTAHDGTWRLMHEAEIIPWVPEIVRYTRKYQKFFLGDGSEYRMRRNPSAAEFSLNPSDAAAETLYLRITPV